MEQKPNLQLLYYFAQQNNIPMQNYQHQGGKVSIREFREIQRFTFHQKPMPALRSHISWDEGENQQGRGDRGSRVQGKPRRRKIFQRLGEAKQVSRRVQGWEREREREVSRSKDRWQAEPAQLNRVKSSEQFMPNPLPGSNQLMLDSRIEAINKKLQSHKSSRNLHGDSFSQNSFSYAKASQNPVESDQINKLQQKLTESTMMLNQHEEVLYKKIPKIQQKLDKNNEAIHNMEALLKNKIEIDKKRNNNLREITVQNGSRLKVKEEELEKVNSDLIHKEYELVKNKEVGKRRELELIRLKRIEDLQKSNLELYQSIEKKQDFGHFQSLQENREELIEGRCWDDQTEGSKLKLSLKGSTIRYQNPQMEISINNTIGEILSPLVLSEYQYCI